MLRGSSAFCFIQTGTKSWRRMCLTCLEKCHFSYRSHGWLYDGTYSKHMPNNLKQEGSGKMKESTKMSSTEYLGRQEDGRVTDFWIKQEGLKDFWVKQEGYQSWRPAALQLLWICMLHPYRNLYYNCISKINPWPPNTSQSPAPPVPQQLNCDPLWIFSNINLAWQTIQVVVQEHFSPEQCYTQANICWPRFLGKVNRKTTSR